MIQALKVLHERERIEHRVLGALRCIDATTRAVIDTPLAISAQAARLTRNGSGLYVIRAWQPLLQHAPAFAAPPQSPALASEVLRLDIHDPSGRYMSRRVAAPLPRDPRPERATEIDSLFRAIDVPMYPSTTAPVSANWVELRVNATDAANGAALGGALVRVRNDTGVLARGLTDWRGEALVPVAGVPVTTWSTAPDAVVVTEIAATLEIIFDPAQGTRSPPARVRDGRMPVVDTLPDPQAIEDAAAALPQASAAITLAAGRGLTLAMTIALPPQ